MVDFLKLAAGLSTYNSGLYDGYVIARAEWQLEGKIQAVKSKIKTEKKDYLVIEVIGWDSGQDFAGRLTVTMLKAKPEFMLERKETHQEQKKGKFLFTEKQVKSYLEKVQDTNPIHRGSRAIVPGLMLLNFILDCGNVSSGKQKHVIRFKEPLPIGASFISIQNGQKIYVLSPTQEICYAETDK